MYFKYYLVFNFFKNSGAIPSFSGPSLKQEMSSDRIIWKGWIVYFYYNQIQK